MKCGCENCDVFVEGKYLFEGQGIKISKFKLSCKNINIKRKKENEQKKEPICHLTKSWGGATTQWGYGLFFP